MYAPTEKDVAYIDFMYDPKNIENCESCPENKGADARNFQRPCGQFHCWVELHCKREEPEEENPSVVDAQQ